MLSNSLFHLLTYEHQDGAIYPAPGSTFSFQDFLSSDLATELMDATAYTGPVDDATRDESCIQDEDDLIELTYNNFYGTSPLSTTPSTPAPSRSPSPPPSDDPKANKRARLLSPHLSTNNPPPTPSNLNATGPRLESTSKSRRDKRKSKEARKNRCRANLDATRPTVAQTIKKHVVPSVEYTTSYNVADIPCASTGFIAKPDEKGRVYELPELLSMGFKLVQWDGRCVVLLC